MNLLNKKNIIYSAFFIILIVIIGLLFNQAKEIPKITNNNSPINNILQINELGSDILPFVRKSKIFIIENNSDTKIPFVSYNDKMFIKSKLYKDSQNLELTIQGDIQYNDSNIPIVNLKPFDISDSKDLLNTIHVLKNELQVKECSKVMAKDIFIYLDKGISMSFRQNTSFIQFNVLKNNKIFIWQERDNISFDDKYLLCNYNSEKLFDTISDYIHNIYNLISFSTIDKNFSK